MILFCPCPCPCPCPLEHGASPDQRSDIDYAHLRVPLEAATIPGVVQPCCHSPGVVSSSYYVTQSRMPPTRPPTQPNSNHIVNSPRYEYEQVLQPLLLTSHHRRLLAEKAKYYLILPTQYMHHNHQGGNLIDYLYSRRDRFHCWS
jgi:hypothetical protein